MPAIFFTSGTEESGRPTIFGSSKVSDWNWNVHQTDKIPLKCEGLLKDYTLPVVTGARLSASFPYVSPAASPDAPRHTLRRVEHQMDGGYYDNYGIVALNRWLDEGFQELTAEFSKIHERPKVESELQTWNSAKKEWLKEQNFSEFLVIQIRYRTEEDEPVAKTDGFIHQLTAPINGLVSSRVAGQSLRSDQQFDMFCRYWKEQGINIENARFDFCGSAALSWHLTLKDKAKLVEQGEGIKREYEEYAASLSNYEPQTDHSEEARRKHKIAMELLDKAKPIGAATWKVIEFLKKQSGEPLVSAGVEER